MKNILDNNWINWIMETLHRTMAISNAMMVKNMKVINKNFYNNNAPFGVTKKGT